VITTILLVIGVVSSIAILILVAVRLRARADDKLERVLRDELREGREEERQSAAALREELAQQLKSATDTLVAAVGQLSQLREGSATSLESLRNSIDQKLETIRSTVDIRLKAIQDDSAKKLEDMRKTVDEQLHTALEKRLTESFGIVSKQLEAVQRGLGEMQALATGVGDLKRVLTNVKARGTWAEVQLGAILEQILTPDQYAANVQLRDDSRERVEYAIRLPGHDGDPRSCIWLPIDAKFPLEGYHRLLEAVETADPQKVQTAVAELGRTVRVCAQQIRDKYVTPPQTTDFGILFLPTEGLYSEVLRQPGLASELQQTYRVTVAGPTTLAAILSSLQMGFRTLAIEQRAGEVWTVLGAVKTEFAKFGDVLTKLRRQLNAATKTIDDTGVRTRAMERKLRDVEQLPPDMAAQILKLPGPQEAEDAEEPSDSALATEEDYSAEEDSTGDA